MASVAVLTVSMLMIMLSMAIIAFVMTAARLVMPLSSVRMPVIVLAATMASMSFHVTRRLLVFWLIVRLLLLLRLEAAKFGYSWHVHLDVVSV